jgi:hypothetical protein
VVKGLRVPWFSLLVHFAPVIAAFLVSRTHKNINKITGSRATVDRFPDRLHERPWQVGQLRLEGEHLEPIGERPVGVRVRLSHPANLAATVNQQSNRCPSETLWRDAVHRAS